jgi:hypothetical protein
MNNPTWEIRGTIKKCLGEYVRERQAAGEIPADIPERELNQLLEPPTERLTTRVKERLNYYLPIIVRGEFEDHIKDLIRNLP